MARSKAPAPQQHAKMSVDEMERGIRRLQKRLMAVVDFDPNTLSQSDPYSTLRPLETDIETGLTETFGRGTIEFDRFSSAASFDWPMTMGDPFPHSKKVEYVTQDRIKSIQLLEAAIRLLRERIEEAQDALPAAPPAAKPATAISKRIFVVHGHDNEPKEAVARFLGLLGYEPIILHERANKGRTIIQKFREEAADVGFAVVLMSPDDVMQDGSHRARQNVVLELGFFLGALGSDRVAAIVKGKVERPSDFDGVVYITFDAAWKVALSKELAAAGYEIDWKIAAS